MLELKQGDILAADVEAVVNTVNCVGVMGRGIALQFRKAYPANFDAYKAACDRGEMQPGKLLVHEQGELTNPKYIINFPTKKHWKEKSRLSYIEEGLAALVAEVRARNIQSIAIPPLGCGLGGLQWSQVRPRIEQAFAEYPAVQVLLFEPVGAPAAEDMVKMTEPPRMTEGRAALLGLMERYLAALMDPFVSLLEIHKLMYFTQEAGERLKLRYSKGDYGPYAENLRHVLNRIEGHFITGYADAGDQPWKHIEMNQAAAGRALDFLQDHPVTQRRFERVVDLVEGFETPFGLELLTTVHWVATQEGAADLPSAIEKTHAWNARKKMFDEHQISAAWNTLAGKNWLPASSEARH